jgi:hypothetical protein
MAIGVWVLAAQLPATTIDVSSQTTQLLQSGDSLTFLFTDSSYAQHATAMAMSASPLLIFFNLISAPVGSAGQFTAGVEAPDGSASAIFPGPVWLTSGAVQMSGYSGPASVLMGSLTLSNALSQQIFAGTEAELVLTYAGPDVTVGLPGYSLKNDVTITLAGGGLSVGAMDYGVTLTSDEGVIAPEPDPVAMLVTTGVLLCAASGAIKRFARVRA